MGDACCAHEEPRSVGEEASTPIRFWEIREVRAATLAGILLAVGLAAGVAGADAAATIAFVCALLVGGSTFVPETVRALLHGRLGVGTLMAIAAVGAGAG